MSAVIIRFPSAKRRSAPALAEAHAKLDDLRARARVIAGCIRWWETELVTLTGEASNG